MNKYLEIGKIVLEKLNNAGHEAYFVGGTSRGVLLNKDVNDIDIATSADPKEIVLALNEYQIANKDGVFYGTIKYLIEDIEVEVTSFRKEGIYIGSRRPLNVSFIKSKEEDSFRRDFTINALYMDKEGNIYDFHNGLNDLKEGIIRTIGDCKIRLKEDALRILRAIRFSLELNMKLSQDIIDFVKENNYLLDDLKTNTKNKELNKIKKLKSKEELDKIFNELNIKLEMN